MKLFSIEEANALLPTVRQVVASISRAHGCVARLRDAATGAAEDAANTGGGFMQEGDAYARSLMRLAEGATELEALGVQLKDYARGLIDFPAMRDGRIVLLCWQLGEGDRLEWWHDMEAGFAGRQPL